MTLKKDIVWTSKFTALIFVALMTIGVLPVRAQEKLVAPIYPGAIRLSPAQLKDQQGVLFAVKDPHDKVGAFYMPRYARKPKGDEGRVKGLTQIPLIAQSGNEVLKIIQSLKRDYTLARPTEVIVEWQSDVLASQNIVNFDGFSETARDMVFPNNALSFFPRLARNLSRL